MPAPPMPSSLADPNDPMLAALRDILREMDDLPLVSAVAARLLRRINQPDTSIRDLADLVSQDSTLAAHVLKIANSSFYRRRAQVNSLEGALMLIGENALKELAIDSSLRSFRAASGPVEKRLQSEARLCAIAARRVAQATNEVDPDEAFLAGMFHHVGQLIMHRRDPETFQQALALSQGNEARALDIERGLFAFSHDMIGAVLLELWDFSPRLVQTVLHHHDFATATGLDETVRRLAATVAVAATLCQTLLAPGGVPSHANVLACPGIAYLQLAPAQIATLQQDLASLANPNPSAD